MITELGGRYTSTILRERIHMNMKVQEQVWAGKAMKGDSDSVKG